MTAFHYCRATATTVILLVHPLATTTVSAWAVQRLSIPRHIRSSRNIIINDVGKISSGEPSSSSSSSSSCGKRLAMLAFDPADFVAVSSAQHDHVVVSSALDALSSLTLAKATSAIGLPPNQSVAPLSETIRSFIEGGSNGIGIGGGGNMIEVIPDMPSMPGGAPRTGNPFLAGTFREIYDAAIQPPNPRMIEYNNARNADGSVTVPSRGLDVVARYADLLSKIPLAAAIYALFDFFLINAEEDVALSELLSYDGDDDDYYDDDDDEYGNGNGNNDIGAIMDVESRVLTQRIVGLLAIVFVTIAWSLMSYHPVPFNEL
ncbi:hypothetical protein ACHAXA_008119 [Cyclostephanos tholiformis]|uniref:Uncharacterized protein n=1 Tax=Cyclostephanos tholiformis TaxID=382380 RepID=A0ABD3SEK4_9STRA